MTEKLWIIYKSGIGFSRMTAEMLQERLEDYFNVFIGSAKKIDPTFLLEEKFDYLIVGDVIKKNIPSEEIQNWLVRYKDASQKENFSIKTISGFYISLKEKNIEPFLANFLQENVKAGLVHPYILELKLNKISFTLENEAFELIKHYSNDLITFLLNLYKNKEEK